MSLSRCILVNSRKTPPVRCGTDRTWAGIMLPSPPLRGMAGRARRLRRWRLGVGPPEGLGIPIFRVLGQAQSLGDRMTYTSPGTQYDFSE